MIFTIIGLIVGLIILAAGIYSWTKDKEDADSRKIAMVTMVVGLVIVVIMVVRWLL